MNILRHVFFWIGLLVLLLPIPVRAEGDAVFVLNSLSVTTRTDIPRLEAAVTVSDVAPIRANLRDGAALNLSLDVILELPRLVLPSQILAESHILYQIRFDPLAREYLLLREAAPPLRHSSLESLLNDVLGDTVIPLVPSTPFTPDDTYRATLTLSLRHAHVPPWLKKALFFWSWDVLAPAAFTLDFQYEALPLSDAEQGRPYA
ncbi:MAG: DUF4390 domain-containing protein [Desulfovibrionaceae bacterium]|nr:DUF4390 domain-containing protein [Desulfovibrionaceae bacterium]